MFSPCCLAGIPWTNGRVAEASSLPPRHLSCEWGNLIHLVCCASQCFLHRALLFGERITKRQECLGTRWRWDQDLREEVRTWLVYEGKDWGHDCTILFTTRHRQECCPLLTTPLHCWSLSPSQNSSNGQNGKLCPLPMAGDTKIDSEYTFFILFSVFAMEVMWIRLIFKDNSELSVQENT